MQENIFLINNLYPIIKLHIWINIYFIIVLKLIVIKSSNTVYKIF
jgi:hypothetical protein